MAENSAKVAYDRYAPLYDEWNAQNDYEMWLGEALLPELEKHGLRPGRALDVGCGTGRAFEPLLSRGWEVVGCDLSTGMLAEAERKFGSRVRLLEADARDLPSLQPFELILLLNDVVNYVTDDGGLEKVFAGVERNLSRDQGLVVFDANSIGLFRASFTAGLSEERGASEWRGLTDDTSPGSVFEARLSGDGVSHLHHQRHWTPEQVKGALEASGLRPLAVLGQSEGAGHVVLADPPDEERDVKIIYIAAHAGDA